MTVATSRTSYSFKDPDEDLPHKSQDLNVRGRSNSPRSHPVLVYDSNEKTVQVKSEKKVAIDKSKKMKLPANWRHFTIFVDPETESQATTKSTSDSGQSNIVLANLYLDRLGKWQQFQCLTGWLSGLYVLNASPFSQTPSPLGD